MEDISRGPNVRIELDELVADILLPDGCWKPCTIEVHDCLEPKVLPSIRGKASCLDMEGDELVGFTTEYYLWGVPGGVWNRYEYSYVESSNELCKMLIKQGQGWKLIVLNV